MWPAGPKSQMDQQGQRKSRGISGPERNAGGRFRDFATSGQHLRNFVFGTTICARESTHITRSVGEAGRVQLSSNTHEALC